MRKKAINSIFVLCLLTLIAAPASAGVPDWLRNLAQQPQKHYADDVNAVRLLEDHETTVKDNGEIVTHARIAYRILRPEGKAYARHELPYDSETTLNYLRGWSITSKGQEYETKDKDGFERSYTSYQIFSDVKERLLSVPGADVGTVVGFEYEQKERPYLFHEMWYFQEHIPVERARLTLQLPSAWEFKASWENHTEVQPISQNGRYVWELSDIPRIEREYHQPPYRALAGHMVITFFSEKIKNQTYSSWNDLGAWYSQLVAPSHQPTPELQQKVRELAPSRLSLLERIRILASFAQHDVRYAAIKMGIGGLRPHPAGEIFSHRYGDCKDKTTILRTMLAEIGVKSYYMPIYDERGIYTDKSTPNRGFNHVIVAIQLPDNSYSTALPAIYEHPRLGHLLIFDPTQELVPFGQLPYYEQDSYSLLVTESGGELIHLPLSKPELNRVARTAKLKLLPDGTLQGQVEEIRSGYRAMVSRDLLKNETEHDRKKMIEHILGQTVTNFQVDGFELVNSDDIDKDLIIRYKFTADHYAKTAGGLLLVRPRVIGELAGAFDPAKPRHYSYEFRAPFLESDSIEITLPEGFKVDELPEPAKATFSFGEYTSKTETAGNVLKYSREYRMAGTHVPLERIEQLKKLFSAINIDEKNMAVLKRAN